MTEIEKKQQKFYDLANVETKQKKKKKKKFRNNWRFFMASL